MSFLDSALKLAEMGFHVFPLHPNSKVPAIDDFPNRATRDAEVIRDWWTCPIMETEKDFNIGISTTKYGDDEALIVIDVDDKDGKEGSKELEKIDMLCDLPDTLVQITPTGGRHLIYSSPTPVKQGTNVLGKGLDIRSKGGYIVGAGSEINQIAYRFWPSDMTNAPQWLIDACGKANVKSDVEVDLSNINQDAAVQRAIHYLEHDCPAASQGERNHSGYIAACKLKDFGVSREQCFELMANHWPCEPMLDMDELEAVTRSAYKYGNEAPGAAAPEAQFERVAKSDEEVENLSYLQKMNTEYALIYMEGQHFILHETIDEKGAPKRVFLTEQTFKRRFSPYSVQKKTTYAQEWLDWKNRREYKGVCFAPEREARNGYYNLWRGFTVSPLEYSVASPDAQRGFDSFMAHARQNICRGDEKLFNWLLGYFSHMVQKPFERPLTTLVFRGGKGTGKNAFVDRIGAILGRGHYLVAHDGRYLTSNFNAHFDSCLCLVLDEAFWSGDKSAEGKLKGLTTAPEIMIERKGKEPYMVDNLVRLIVIGNESWLVPASADERRYAVYDVGDGMKQNRKFFHDMRVLMDEKGGNRILLHFLKTFDLSKVDINAAPKTQALLDQKLSTLEPFELWWFGCLTSGRIIGSDFGSEWQTELDKERFRQAFIRHCRESNIRSRLPDERSVGKMLKVVVPNYKTNKKRASEGWEYTYEIPGLEDARKDFEKFIGQQVEWA